MDWNKIRQNRFAPDAAPIEWPHDVKPISLEGISLLGIDGDGALYWDGRKIVTQRRFTLSLWQGLLAFAAAAGALMSGVVDVLSLCCK